MTKQIKNVYSTLCTYENLYKAYIQARKCKRYRNEILEFSFNLEENLLDINRELENNTYKVGSYREFYIYEPKQRLIMALPFKDRIVQWGIYQLLNPVFDKSYIYDSYGCRIGKGTLKAIQRLHYWLRLVGKKDKKFYYLKLDVSKYYYRVDHEILIDILKKRVKDNRMIEILKTIINYKGTLFGLKLNGDVNNLDDRIPGKGIPIGNLTSQMFANLYLNELDQYCKRTLSIKYYIRYMDDVIILSDDKKQLHDYKNLIQKFLERKLKLNLNKKTAIRPISCGIEFVGYRLWPTHVKIRKSTSLKMKKRIKYVKKQYERKQLPFEKVNATVQSYMGILKHCNSYLLQEQLFNNLNFKINHNEE
jgi:retron-type reverse transcriptase